MARSRFSFQRPGLPRPIFLCSFLGLDAGVARDDRTRGGPGARFIDMEVKYGRIRLRYQGDIEPVRSAPKQRRHA